MFVDQKNKSPQKLVLIYYFEHSNRQLILKPLPLRAAFVTVFLQEFNCEN